jgi:hypothetical protein
MGSGERYGVIKSMSLPSLPKLPSSKSSNLLGTDLSPIKRPLQRHLLPVSLRDSRQYKGRVRALTNRTYRKEDTQLWRPLLQESVSAHILHSRRRQTLQDSLRAPATRNISLLYKKVAKQYWSTAYSGIARQESSFNG